MYIYREREREKERGLFRKKEFIQKKMLENEVIPKKRKK